MTTDEYLNQSIKCPYCGATTTIGETVMISGTTGCGKCYLAKGGLRDYVCYLLDKNYARYLDKDSWYPNGFEENQKELCSISDEDELGRD